MYYESKYPYNLAAVSKAFVSGASDVVRGRIVNASTGFKFDPARDQDLAQWLADKYEGLGHNQRFVLCADIMAQTLGQDIAFKTPLEYTSGYPATETFRTILNVLLRHPRRENLQRILAEQNVSLRVKCVEHQPIFITSGNTVSLYRTSHPMAWHDEQGTLLAGQVVAGLIFENTTQVKKRLYTDFFAATGPLSDDTDAKSEATLLMAKLYFGHSNWRRYQVADKSKVEQTFPDRLAWCKRSWADHGVKV